MLNKDKIEIYQSNEECEALKAVLKKTENIPGDIAEVGVYRGGSAKIIADMVKDKQIYLFDTFEGLPTNTIYDKDRFPPLNKGSMKETSVEEVRKYVPFKNVHIYKGVFPKTAGVIKDKRFSFVHLDTDLYVGTKAGLKFFYPRMNKGGIFLIHDYPCFLGVEKAVIEFLLNKKEQIKVLTVPRQGWIIKL